MSFLELAKKRCSVRSYKNSPVERDKIERCLEAARLAPSACNAQPWEFIVVRDPELTFQLAAVSAEKVPGLNKWAGEAPVFIVVLSKKPNLSARMGAAVTKRPFWLMDVGMASEHFCLQAAEEGLGTCMLGWFNEKKVKDILSLGRNDKVVLLITLGYTSQETVPKKVRRPLEEMSRFI